MYIGPLSGDLAYFDGLTEIILTAGLVLPKPGIFQEHIQFLLVLTTPVDIVILGVSFTGEKNFISYLLSSAKLIFLIRCWIRLLW